MLEPLTGWPQQESRVNCQNPQTKFLSAFIVEEKIIDCMIQYFPSLLIKMADMVPTNRHSNRRRWANPESLEESSSHVSAIIVCHRYSDC